jgi:hypothetical protein
MKKAYLSFVIVNGIGVKKKRNRIAAKRHKKRKKGKKHEFGDSLIRFWKRQ